MPFADRRRQTSITQGPGPLVLEPPVNGFKTIASAFAAGEVFPLAVVGYNSDLSLSGQWVVGTGHLDVDGHAHLDVISDSDNFAGAWSSTVVEIFVNYGARELEAYIGGIVGVAIATAIVAAIAGLSFTHAQTSPSTTWTINHNLGFRPAVTVLDDGNNEVEADVIHISANQVQVFFNLATTGTARLT